MRQLRLLGLLSILPILLGGFSAASANAEDGQPAILCLVECGKGLLIKLNGNTASLVTLSGKALTVKAIETTASVCEGIPGTGDKDVNSCTNTVELTGVKQGKVSCRSESSGGTKDAIETVLSVVDLHMAAEKTSAGELQSLFLIRMLGQAGGEEELIINCGGVKDKEKGTIGCLLTPGLREIAPGEALDMTCSISETSHDRVTGECEESCEWLKEHPFEMNLGAGFEDGWLAFTIAGSTELDVFLDD